VLERSEQLGAISIAWRGRGGRFAPEYREDIYDGSDSTSMVNSAQLLNHLTVQINLLSMLLSCFEVFISGQMLFDYPLDFL
jgi:hypothetical protein